MFPARRIERAELRVSEIPNEIPVALYAHETEPRYDSVTVLAERKVFAEFLILGYIFAYIRVVNFSLQSRREFVPIRLPITLGHSRVLH